MLLLVMFQCPFCFAECSEDKWVQLDQTVGLRPPLRLLNVQILLTTTSSHQGELDTQPTRSETRLGQFDMRKS